MEEYRVVVLQDEWVSEDYGALTTEAALKLPLLTAAHVQNCGVCGGFIGDNQDSYNWCESGTDTNWHGDCNEMLCDQCFYSGRTCCMSCEPEQDVPETVSEWPEPPSVVPTEDLHQQLEDLICWAFHHALFANHEHLGADKELIVGCVELQNKEFVRLWVSPPVNGWQFYLHDARWREVLPPFWSRHRNSIVKAVAPSGFPKDMQRMIVDFLQ